ncbi:hypothetical protein FOC1_g10008424 [Fusarium oxysporum f. sp. cubense race 1]|uniref:Uncharacterized protein n=1 Tax=Fusarium oxysporum f. sp. cubense (strain race 1) TaxID=1229664 RepID=N4UI93_FUSC1|nr:hypothetical protein FOC1_g10008424 [Fusarium oxysporum f. sp. cubense race 1]
MDTEQPVICIRYRAAWPSLPRLPLDVSRTQLPSSIHDRQGEIFHRVERILQKNNISGPETEIELVVRQMNPTVLIKSPWKKDSKTKGLHVEMIAPQNYETVYIGVVEEDVPWDDIRAVAKRHLDSSDATRNYLSTLALTRRGFSKPEENPITVYIGCLEDSDETKWDGIIDGIESEFCERGWMDIVVHIEHNWPFTRMTVD